MHYILDKSIEKPDEQSSFELIESIEKPDKQSSFELIGQLMTNKIN